MATTKPDLASEVAHYAATFHDVIGYGHHVASPLGAWLLLALAAPAAAGEDAATLARLLGGGAAGAAGQAADLLAAPHPLVAAAAAVWGHPGALSKDWLAGLPAAVNRGEVPAQTDLDRWARDHTFGLIENFPLRVSRLVDFLFATALATKVSWAHPFDLAPGSALGGSSPWAGRLGQVLRSPKDSAHMAFIAPTEQAGDVAVHLARARGGLLVASVIAESEVAPARVLAEAHRIAIAIATRRPVPRRSLFDLPLGTAPLWDLREQATGSTAGERCVAFLPAWSATSQHDLKDPRLGFAAVVAALKAGGQWDATQAAMAKYTRIGFEAAAVTAIMRLTAAMPRMGRSRTAELRFGHPYAVVAVTEDDNQGPWHGVPVFSAWVARPSEA
ncbi:MAG TPA: hypothetical protein VMA95_00430 [Streptosporangiaceae bacterium]|nr:hypothetical protein [Streptosporangiaceae bacterium]